MPKANRRFRFSLKSLFVLTTLTGILTYYFNFYQYYHATPREVQLGSYHVISGKPGDKHLCDCEIYFATNYHDILEQRTGEKQKKLHQLVLSVIRAVPFEEKCDARLVSLRKQIKDCVSKEVGSFQGYELVNEVILSKYSVIQKPTGLFLQDFSQSHTPKATTSQRKATTSRNVAAQVHQ